MSGDVRCTSKLHGRLVPNPLTPGELLLEIKCDSRFCKGWTPGAIVLHYFNLSSGELLETKRFRESPEPPKVRRDVKDR